MTTRRSGGRARAAALALALTLHGTRLVTAQAPTPMTPPPAPGPAGAPATAPLTLADVVGLAVNNNSSVVLARQRLKKYGYQIALVTAQAGPQLTGTLVDTYSSQKTSGTSGGANVANPTLPGGGSIPIITDQGGGTSSTFVGGGGGGTAASNGSTATTGGTSAPATSRGTTVTTGGLAGGGTGTGAATGGATTGGGATGGAGASTGTGTGGAGAGTGSAGGATGQAVALAEPPAVLQHYAAATGRASGAAAPRADTTTGGSGGTGTTTSAGTSTPGNTVGTGAFGGGSSGHHNNYSGRISLTQYLDVFGLVPTTKDVQKITQEFYQLDLERVTNETALAAKDDFFTVLRDQAQVSVDQEQVNAAAANLRITQVRQIAGAVAEADVLTAAVTLANDQQTQNSDRNALSLASANLDNLLNLPAGQPLALQAPPLPPINAVIDLDRSTKLAFQQRPELRQAENNIVIANRLIRLAGAGQLPTVGLSGTASYAGYAQNNAPHDDYALTAQVSIPLYDGGYARAQVGSAKVDLQTQLVTRAQLQQNVTLEVRQAYLNILNDQGSAATATVNVANAREAARIAALQFQYGTNTQLNVLNADAQLATAETNALNAQFSYQTDLATLVRAIGGR